MSQVLKLTAQIENPINGKILVATNISVEQYSYNAAGSLVYDTLYINLLSYGLYNSPDLYGILNIYSI